MTTRLVLLLALTVGLAADGFADKVVLKDGRSFEGEVLEDSAEVVKIKTAKTTLTFKKDEVVSVERGDSPLQQREKCLVALDGENTAAYTDFVAWMETAPKEFQDEKLMRRVANIACFLDPAVAAATQTKLGDWLLARGASVEAARAYSRVLAADPANAAAKKKLADLSTALKDISSKELTQLRAAIQAAKDSRYAEALPELRKARRFFFADHCKEFTKVSIDELADDMQRRVPCPVCKGAATHACTHCKGTGLVDCPACKGTGVKKEKSGGGGFSAEACPRCFHLGTVLCAACGAERVVSVHFNLPVEGKSSIDLKTTPATEKVQIAKVCNTSSWTSRDGTARVTSITAGAPTKGGTQACTVCHGIKYDPPASAVNAYGMQDYLGAIDDRLSGKVPLDPIGAAAVPYDEDEVGDKKFKWVAGKWEE